ncbi:MAG: PQQ-dependent sugar dehydrogenase [Flavobacteriales bacterium]|nr:PQQ-dependent sugar dehydrogenase [Flavobacteriales bacterium]
MSATGQAVPADFSTIPVSSGWNEPQGMVWDDAGRMYVWEKAGQVWIVEPDGTRLVDPLIDLSEEVGNWRDQGMLGFALDPSFATNGHIYMLYTVDRHHLMNFGTGSYSPASNEYFAATIIRLSRYTVELPLGTSVDPNSRTVLLGESPQTGIPLLHESHGPGTLLFGTDGSLLVSVGDGASFSSTDVGSASESYYATALQDGIIRPEDNVGSFRSQMVNSLNGKVLRLDPATGDGLPSNPFYDANDARAPCSRVWALGLRNPFRMSLRPGSGSPDPANGDPGTLYIGDVGWFQWEEINVCYEPGMNFGWPLFEGLEENVNYASLATPNGDAPVPGYDAVICQQQFYFFQDLLVQDTPIHLNGHPDPCDPNSQVPVVIPHFFHSRPTIDYQHSPDRSRTGIFNGNQAATIDLDDLLSPVPGPPFSGYASIGGTWFSGQGWPAEYQQTYFHADFAGGWIKRFEYDQQDSPMSVHDFASGLGLIVQMAQAPDGCLYYIRYSNGTIWKICYDLVADLPPVAVASQDVQFGPGPLLVAFEGSASYDNESPALDFLWEFGDGGTSSDVAPTHLFNAPPGVPTSYTVVLTVTDTAGQTNSTSLLVSVNNTPPEVAITSFPNGHEYPPGVDTVYVLEADVMDLEHGPGQLSYAWRTTLHHNTHIHPEPIDPAIVSSTVISGVGCDDDTYSYSIELTVTDAEGLSTTVTHWLYPRCSSIPPVAIIRTNTLAGPGPLAVQFDGADSYDPGMIVSYQWDFGDGSFSSDPTPMHVYPYIGEHVVTLTVTDDNGMTDQANVTISVISTAPPQCSGPAGQLLREVWTGVPGTSLANLVGFPNYPDAPSSSGYISTFQGPTNLGNNYGTRVRGYIVPSTTGFHTFIATSDDHSAVFLSPNAQERYKRQICNIVGNTGATQLTKYASQRSAPIWLEAGRYYYVEMLHKEGSGGDHFALWWERPQDPTAVIIDGAFLVAWEDCPTNASLRSLLSGCYVNNTGLMRDDLRAAGLIPLQEPYTAAGMLDAQNGGQQVDPSMLQQAGPGSVVDWVLVQLRDKNDPTIVVDATAALITRAGNVRTADGYDRILFDVPADQYYIALLHRNHLGIMTADPVGLDRDLTLVDLSSAATNVAGTDPRLELVNGRMAMFAGDALKDEVLKYTGSSNDRDRILLTIGGSVPTAVVFGYNDQDLNMDGKVKYAGQANDRDVLLNMINGSVPTAVRMGSLPN